VLALLVSLAVIYSIPNLFQFDNGVVGFGKYKEREVWGA